MFKFLFGNKNTVGKISLIFKGKKYELNINFGKDISPKAAKEILFNGVLSCDSVLADHLRRVYSTFPKLKKGNNQIEIHKFSFGKE